MTIYQSDLHDILAQLESGKISLEWAESQILLLLHSERHNAIEKDKEKRSGIYGVKHD